MDGMRALFTERESVWKLTKGVWHRKRKQGSMYMDGMRDLFRAACIWME